MSPPFPERRNVELAPNSARTVENVCRGTGLRKWGAVHPMNLPGLFLQLHSLRREMASDAEGVLRQVPSWGFAGVEMISDYGWSAGRWRALLAETGLSVVAAHGGLEAVEGDCAERLAFYRALGVEKLVVTALPRAPQTAGRYHDGAARLNAVGRRLRSEGFSLVYHHHDFEFQWREGAGGRCGFDILLGETDPVVVGFEFDTHWLESAGHEAADFIGQHADRTRLIHAKDRRKEDGRDVPAGQGSVNFREILARCAAQGWPVVLEYEGVEAVEGVRAGARHLRSLMDGTEGNVIHGES